MKPARILPLLLIALALIAPRMASAQKNDSIWIVADCGTNPGFDWGFVNRQPQFVNGFLLIISTNSVNAGFSFANGGTGEDGKVNQGRWSDSTTAFTGSDTAVYYPLNAGGDATGIRDSAHFFLLGGPGGIQFLDSLYGKDVTIEWEALSGNTVDTFGYFPVIIPTSYQGQCSFDTVTATGATVGCDPNFNFHVFDRTGLTIPIGQMKFELQGASVGSIRPSEIKAPDGWSVDTVTERSVLFVTSTNTIPYGENLNGFIVPLRANPLATTFTFDWTAYDQYGALIDADSVVDSIGTQPQCSEDPSSDSVYIPTVHDCTFQFDEMDYHNGLGLDTVSPLTSYTFTIATPGVTWDPSSIILPPQATRGTWEYSVSGNRLNFRVVPKYALYGQPAGTIWTPGAAIINPSFTQNVIVQWSDSIGTSQTSSGMDTINCNHTSPDIYSVTPGSDCSYTLTIKNAQTQPEKSINAITVTMPVALGTFDTASSCFSASNGWQYSAPGNNSLRFFNTKGASSFLTYGNTATFSFCIDPTHTDSSWTLSWTPIDSANNAIVLVPFDTLVAGCSPPLVCDSVRHVSDTGLCSETITVLNLRQGGAVVDSVIVTPTAPWSIETAVAPLLWVAKISPDKDTVLFTGNLTAGDSRQFFVSYNNGSSTSSNVQVTTLSNGAVCTNTTTTPVTCAISGVSPSDVAQTLAVSVVPNPMNDEADIMLTTGAFDRVQMTLVDVLGRTSKTVLNSTITAGDHDYTLDVSQLPPGTYYLRIVASGATLTKKLVIQH